MVVLFTTVMVLLIGLFTMVLIKDGISDYGFPMATSSNSLLNMLIDVSMFPEVTLPIILRCNNGIVKITTETKPSCSDAHLFPLSSPIKKTVVIPGLLLLARRLASV